MRKLKMFSHWIAPDNFNMEGIYLAEELRINPFPS